MQSSPCTLDLHHLPHTGLLSSFDSRAPEVCGEGGMYGKAVDMWSVGCFLHVLLFGTHPPPFNQVTLHGSNNSVIIIMKAFVVETFQASLQPPQQQQWKGGEGVSEGARGLLRAMMETLPSRRISAADALTHPWIRVPLPHHHHHHRLHHHHHHHRLHHHHHHHHHHHRYNHHHQLHHHHQDRSQVPKVHLANTVANMARFNHYRALKVIPPPPILSLLSSTNHTNRIVW